MQQLKTIHEAAEQYHLPEGTLRRYLKAGILQSQFDGKRYLIDVEQLLQMQLPEKKRMTLGKAAGIFSDIDNPKFNDREKAVAIFTVMKAWDFAGVKRDAMKAVICWMWNRSFRIRKDGSNSKPDQVECQEAFDDAVHNS